jgi:hypothetical protein
MTWNRDRILGEVLTWCLIAPWCVVAGGLLLFVLLAMLGVLS